ncbi:unnamed protein product [Caenorhabditis auriculariae]|uniref:Uncharacterized protein n=1 Tax=Caenorhabditis auriculariae TaxID=2777116 RepID=A0A8S1HQU4_9PELO|nr:unnamed protein product [Caenorhabditis auriculariae]
MDLYGVGELSCHIAITLQHVRRGMELLSAIEEKIGNSQQLSDIAELRQKIAPLSDQLSQVQRLIDNESGSNSSREPAPLSKERERRSVRS